MRFRISRFLYRCLLSLYPADFRKDYEVLMLLVFEEACYEAQARNSWRAWGKLWWTISLDLSTSLYHEHKDTFMTTKIDHYEVNATLGEGSAATLYRAYDPERASQVALKVLKQDADIKLRPHFEREGKVHITLKNPHIPACYAYRESEGVTYMVMQYIHGKSLLEILQERNRPFDVRQVVEWGMIACDVLTYLHEQGYVYRDMKPANLMLDSKGFLYLIDYGIIILAEGDGIAIGTIGYAPPEQYKGICTVQSDLYALGASLHHLLTNRDPRSHEAHSFNDALPSRYNPQVSAELEAVLMQALAPQPEDRFATAEAMKQALSNALIA